MNLRLLAFLTVLLLFPATRSWGQSDEELYHAEVCNGGQIAVDVAMAYKEFGFFDEFWVIDYWAHVPSGACKTVFYHFYAPNNLFSFRSFPLHLAFAFTDSAGVWGAAKVSPPNGIAASNVKLCVGGENYAYRVDGKTPEAGNCPSGLLIPASIDWEPTSGVPASSADPISGFGPPRRFSVALGSADRAIPFGGLSSSTEESAETQYNRGVQYYTGEGVPKDEVQAASWVRKAAERGHGQAQFVLGMMYYEGKGVPLDWVQAYVWLTLAVAAGHEGAKAARALLQSLLTPDQIAEASALAIAQAFK